MTQTYNRIKKNNPELDDANIKDNADAYDEAQLIANFQSSLGGQAFRKRLVRNAQSSLEGLLNSSNEEITQALIKFKADIKILREYDGIPEEAELLFETIKDLIQ